MSDVNVMPDLLHVHKKTSYARYLLSNTYLTIFLSGIRNKLRLFLGVVMLLYYFK